MDDKRKLPLGIQNFAEIIEKGYLYIDKTEYIHRMISQGKLYFLARPRRFGKSVLLSTLAALFQGRRELFQGLYIENRWNWHVHSVIHLNFLGIENNSTDLLAQGLCFQLDIIAKQYGLSLQAEGSVLRFRELIEGLANQGPLVVLIDEYDKPILDQLQNSERVEKNRQFLATFFGVIKGLEARIAFALLTGVSKFAHVSLFSELNNLTDVSLDSDFAGMIGYTEAELEQVHPYFPERVGSLSGTALLDAVRSWYNGYSWDGKTRVYNPVSVLNFVRTKEFLPFWFSTGTARFLIDLVRSHPIALQDLETVTISHQVMESFEPSRIVPEVLFFQTGYLTIKDVRRSSMGTFYQMGYPNHEVKEAFLSFFLADSASNPTVPGPLILRMNDCLVAEDFDGHCNSFSARSPTTSSFRAKKLITTR